MCKINAHSVSDNVIMFRVHFYQNIEKLKIVTILIFLYFKRINWDWVTRIISTVPLKNQDFKKSSPFILMNLNSYIRVLVILYFITMIYLEFMLVQSA